MPRYKLIIEYDGSNFCGWQQQVDLLSVQGILQKAIFAFSRETPRIFGAGRTDSGVHATGQVAHFDLLKEISTDKVRDALNYHIKPHLVAILKVEKVSENFHARFSAVKRYYLYRILDRRPPLTLTKGQIWRTPFQLNPEVMQNAADHLVGEHDFTTFRARECQAHSPVKILDRAEILRVKNEIHCLFSARSFLHRQVRSMVGSLVCVGSGKWNHRDFKQALAACNRKACGPVAPPDGLYLTGVDYP